MAHGKTYLRANVRYGTPPRPGRGQRNAAPVNPGPPPPAVTWAKVSGPGTVTFADPSAWTTTATFSVPGEYVLGLTADSGTSGASATLTVKVELPPPPSQLIPVVTKRHQITSPLWAARTRILITTWIPHLIDQCNRTDIPAGRGDGGIDNFIEAAKALRGEPYAPHKGYVFSNAWVHQTVESMSLALMVDPQGDQEMIAAQQRMKDTLEDWIPKILAAQHPDGYLQTAFTLRDAPRPANATNPGGSQQPSGLERWQPSARANHEGYVSGYFLESAINHYSMTDHKDARLYNAAKKLADCWADHIGPPPKQQWFDGHQEMEQALVRFGRFVESSSKGGVARTSFTSRLPSSCSSCRRGRLEASQSHLPVVQQYEAVGHAVRAVYTYSGMADVAVETHDVDYQRHRVNRSGTMWCIAKYYVTGGDRERRKLRRFLANYSLREQLVLRRMLKLRRDLLPVEAASRRIMMRNTPTSTSRRSTMRFSAPWRSTRSTGSTTRTNLRRTGPRSAWHSVPCCTGNIPRTLLMLPTWMYSKEPDAIYVNLFAGSRITVEGVAGTDVEMVQTTNYPWDGKVQIGINPATAKSFAVRIRVPNRDVSALYTSTPAANGITSIAVNGHTVTPTHANGYASITRNWKTGDIIEFDLPMTVQRVRASNRIAADVDRVALRYGPLVYNFEKVDQDIDGVLPPTAALTSQWRGDLLGGVTVITGTFADGSPALAIPNFARCNRNPPPPQAPAPVAAVPGAARQPAPPPPPLNSIVWVRES